MEKSTNSEQGIKGRVENAVGSHPVGVGIGAVGTGAAAGAIGGAVGGPIGAAVGATAGAVAGGIAGGAVAESINPTLEEKYWQDNFIGRPYYNSGGTFEDYSPAFRYGWESAGRHDKASNWEKVEGDLGRGWDKFKGKSRLGWEHAKHAVKDAWERVRSGAHRAMDRKHT